jgi:hypothetical protein
MKSVIAGGEFGLSLNQRAKTADNFPYQTLLLSKLFGQKREWTLVSCLTGSKDKSVLMRLCSASVDGSS